MKYILVVMFINMPGVTLEVTYKNLEVCVKYMKHFKEHKHIEKAYCEEEEYNRGT